DSFFTTDASVIIKYFNSESDAKNNRNPINSSLTVTNSGTYFLRFEKTNSCANWAQLTINVKIPKASSTLKDVQICKDATTILDAGTGFSAYLWSNGDTTQTTSLGIGNHYVDLTFNGCTYRQLVNVTAAETPKIDNIEVTGTTANITVSGGSAPYQYSLDGINFQNSNIFKNIPRGTHTVYVKDKNGCELLETKFLIINLINAITPNGDGKNDFLDYSDLKIKDQVSIKIFDRQGSLVYQSNGKNYIWDGKVFGRTATSGTYWYIISWTEPLTQTPVSFTGWILVKNRN
ncbi:T9SS type B sorting domain-containing protein, partial [Cloacibacterium rupense]